MRQGVLTRGALTQMACAPRGTWRTVRPALAAAALSQRDGSIEPCVIVSNSDAFARPGDGLGSAQRLAIMAVDFSRWRSRSFDCLVAPCGCRCDPRPVKSQLSSLDAADRADIADALPRIGVAHRLVKHHRLSALEPCGSRGTSRIELWTAEAARALGTRSGLRPLGLRWDGERVEGPHAGRSPSLAPR